MDSLIYGFYFFLVTFNVFIVCPFIFYYCYKIWKLRNDEFFRRRYPELTIAACLCYIIFYPFPLRVIADIPNLFPWIQFGFNSQKWFYPYFSHLPWVLLVTRGWLLYFEYSYGIQLIAAQFSSKLNDDNNNMSTSISNHWTFKYHKYLHTKSNIYFYIPFLWVLLTEIVTVSVTYFSLSWGYFIYTLLFVILNGFGCILVYKIRPCRDELYLRKEFKLLSHPAMFYLIAYFSVAIFLINNNKLRALALYYVSSIGANVTCYISTKWIFDKYKYRYSNTNRLIRYQINNDNKEINDIKLTDILKKEESFDLFALHLVKEFSVENLLFLYETIKFKSECVKHGIIKQDNIGIMVDFGKRSNYISKEINDMKSFWMHLNYIINRYIDNYGVDCINLSSSVRLKIKAFQIEMDSNNKNETEIINKFIILIDEAINEIIQLLSADSLMRFCNSDSFQQIASNFNNDIVK